MKVNFSLKQVSTFLVLLAVLGPFFGIIAWYSSVSFNYRLENELSSARASNQLLKLQFESEIDRLKSVLTNKSQSISLEIAVADHMAAQQKITALIGFLIEGEAAVREAAVFSASGELIAIVRPDSGITANQLLTPQQFQQLATEMGFGNSLSRAEIAIPMSGEIHVGSPMSHQFDDQFAFSMAFPIGAPATAVLVVLIDIDQLWTSSANTSMQPEPKRTQQYLLDSDGALIAGLEGSKFQLGESMVSRAIVRSAVDDQSWPTTQPYRDSNEQIVFGTLTAIPELGWSLVSEVNAAKIKEPILQTLSQLVFPVVLGISFLIWLELRLITFISRPIHLAGTAIKKVTRGDYDLDLKSSGIQEFDAIFKDFKQMALTRQQVEAELYAREQDLAITLNSIGDGVIVTDINSRITQMNPIAEQLTDWTIEQANGQHLDSVFRIIDGSNHNPIDRVAEQVLASKTPLSLNGHTTLISSKGSQYQLSATITPILDNNAKAAGVVLVFSDVSTAYWAREAAAETQRQLQAMFDGMQGMVFETDTEGNMTFLSARLKAIIGESSLAAKDDPSLQKSKLWDLVGEHFGANLPQKIKGLCDQAATGEAVKFDINFISDEQSVWRAYSIYPVSDKNGKITRLLHQTIDITQRKQTEEDALTSLNLLKLYREQSPVATIGWDLNMQIIDWNRAATELFGYSESEAKDSSFREELVPPRSNLQVTQAWEKLMTGQPTETILETTARDGHTVLSEWHSAPLKDLQNNVIGVASRVLDITAEHEARLALLAREHEQREILDSMMDAVMSIDLSGKVLSFNQAAVDLFEFSRDEVVGKSVHQILAPPYIAEFEQFRQRYLAGDHRPLGKARDFAGQRKDGSSFPMRLTINALPDDGSGLARFIGSCHDLSQFKQQEEQLRRAQRMDALGMLTGGIAHDYNNMLGVIIGYSGMLERKLTSQPKLAKHARQILRSAERGASLTKKLLGFSRHDRQTRLITERVDINALINDQLEILQKTLTVRIALAIDLEEHAWPVWLDSNDLEDAILNMSINAFHAMSDSSGIAKLTISTANTQLEKAEARALGIDAGEYVEMMITDTGMGMGDEIKEKIFDPFFSTKGTDGSGLGLSQVFGFITRANGGIKVHSTLGIGSEFTLYFPRYIENIANPAKTVTLDHDLDKGSFQGNGERILVVDDEVDLNEFITELLTEQGYEIYSALNSNSALDLLKQQPVDLLYCDVVMPGIDGYQLAEQVQQLYPHIKIQMTSGYTEDRQQKISDQSLHINVLYKPVNPPQILKRIRNLLNETTGQDATIMNEVENQ